MKKSKLLIAFALCAVLFAFKAFFPAETGDIIEKASNVFRNDIDYSAVFSELSEALPVFAEREEPEEELESSVQTRMVLQPVEHSTFPAAMTVELAVNRGEYCIAEERTPPPAVAAFLESQSEYADYAVPENVSYEYIPYPDENAVPVAGYNSSGFGYRLHPIKGEVRFHYGTDFAAWSGEEIRSFADGTVSFAGYSDSYGNYITIDHGGGWESLYAHCSRLDVETGERVEAGQTIALVGATGLVTGPHLHFELTKDDVYVNPEYYVN